MVSRGRLETQRVCDASPRLAFGTCHSPAAHANNLAFRRCYFDDQDSSVWSRARNNSPLLFVCCPGWCSTYERCPLTNTALTLSGVIRALVQGFIFGQKADGMLLESLMVSSICLCLVCSTNCHCVLKMCR